MPRPRKPRRCNCFCRRQVFGPMGRSGVAAGPLALSLDELESLRLCDLEGLTQGEAGERMGVSRGTVQRTVKSGRRKIVAALVSGSSLIINPHEGEIGILEEQ